MRRAAAGRGVLAALLIVGGLLHFVAPARYTGIIPAWLPSPMPLVLLSGVAEVAGGVLLLSRWRPPLVRWYLVLLLLAILPANVEMLRQGVVRGAPSWGLLLLWLRLPLQAVLIWWGWRLTASPTPTVTGAAGPV